MKNPDFYDHEVKGKVRHLQTHISHIFLTGTYAYKVKKPFNLGFLDFSSLEKRKYYCREELRLNKIFSPDIYLSLIKIYEKNGEYNLKSGNIAEYAVKMKEFNQDDILDEMVKTGKADENLFSKLARKLHRLHGCSATDSEIASYGRPEAIFKIAGDNFEQTKAFIGQSIDSDALEKIRRRTFDFLENHKTLLEKRKNKGKIKECHGDLHLKNICLYNDEIQLFDRIEFNEEFKNIDVIYDLSFLIMDLIFKGYESFASVMMNEYLERSGDYRGARLLKFYASMRAFIRGKVTSLKLEDSGISQKEKQKAKEEAKDYFSLSHELIKKKEPKLIIMNGVSGTGKSTVAQEVSRKLNFLVIRSDAYRKHLAGVPLYEKGPKEIYTPSMSRKTYEEIIEEGIAISQTGLPVILDAKFDKKKYRDLAIGMANEHGVKIKILRCHANKRTLQSRLEKRKNDVSDANIEILKHQLKHSEPIAESEKQLVINFDTEKGSYDQLVEKIKTVL